MPQTYHVLCSVFGVMKSTTVLAKLAGSAILAREPERVVRLLRLLNG